MDEDLDPSRSSSWAPSTSVPTPVTPHAPPAMLVPTLVGGGLEADLLMNLASPQGDSDDQDVIQDPDLAPTSLSIDGIASPLPLSKSPGTLSPHEESDTNPSGIAPLPSARSESSDDEAQVPFLSPVACVPTYGATSFSSAPVRVRRASTSSVWSAPAGSYDAPPLEIGSGAEQARTHRQLVFVFAAIFCVCFMTSLESNTAYLYYNWGLSEFGALASFSTVSIAQQMVYAVIKPPIATLSDIFGRSHALACALVLYSGGYALVASSGNFRLFLTGIVIQSAGMTGIQVLQSILVADMTSPRYRGLVLGAINMPYLINFALAGPLAQFVVRHASWRVGIALYAVLIPLAGSPLLILLATSTPKAPTQAESTASAPASAASPATPVVVTFSHKCHLFARSIDFIGFFLFAAGWLMVLLPLTLRDRMSLAENVCYALAGLWILVLCGWWQTRTETPLVPWRVLHNHHVVAACAVGLVDFASFTLSWTYISAFVQIVKGWDQTRTAYFSTTQTITMTLTGLLVGWAMSTTKKFRTLLLWGAVVRLTGVGLMVRFRNAHDPTYLWVLCQLLQGVGGGAVAITMQVGAQVCATSSDVATVTAFQLLVTEVGAALGSAGAGLITSSTLPHLLDQALSQLSPLERRKIYGSLSTALSYPLGSVERTGIITAWAQVMRTLCLAAFGVMLPALGFAYVLPDKTLRANAHRTPSTSFAARRSGPTHAVPRRPLSSDPIVPHSPRHRRPLPTAWRAKRPPDVV